MLQTPRILIIGTGDTKADELGYMHAQVKAAGGAPVMLDVSILGDPPYRAEHDKHAVAAAAGSTIPEIVALGDENSAMTVMAEGAARLTRRLYEDGQVDGFIALGGTWGPTSLWMWPWPFRSESRNSSSRRSPIRISFRRSGSPPT
jgi:uncharacterized protein (UPF0261 family)